MQNVDLSQRDRFEEERKDLFDEAPERRRELSERTTVIINTEVDTQIVSSVLNVKFGCVGGWPSGVNRKNRSHINRAYADGYHFDKSARRREEAKAIEVEAYVKEIIEKLEG